METDDPLVDIAKKFAESQENAKKVEDEFISSLLPEVDSIHNERLALFVRGVLFNAPETFWRAQSSWNDFNPPDEQGEGGLVLHIKRAVRCYVLICDAKQRSQEERDYGIAAILIKDILKAGYDVEDMQINKYHIIDLDGWIRDLYDQHKADEEKQEYSSLAVLEEEELEVLIRLARVHMGRFSLVPELTPQTYSEWDIHLADYLSSSLHYILDGDEEKAFRWTAPKAKKK